MMNGLFLHIRRVILLCVLAAPIILAARASTAIPATPPPGPKNPAALLPAIMRAYRAGKGEFIIPPGAYKLSEPRGRFYWSFDNMRNFRIIGKGVTLLRTDPTKGGIEFNNCRNITLDGVTLRCDPIPYTQGRIIAINHKKDSMVLRINKGYQTDLTNPARFGANPAGTVFSPKTFRILSGSLDFSWGKITPIGPREFRCLHLSTLAFMQVGDLATFRSQLRSDILLLGCRAVCIRHVTIMGGTGFCFHEQGGGGDNRYIDDAIVYPPKPRGATVPPLQASNADGLHSNLVRHGPSIIGCHFEGMGDDGIAIHGWYAMLRRATGRRWVVLFPFGQTSFFRVGDRLKLYDPHGGYLGRTRVVSVKPLKGYKPIRPTALPRENPGSFSGPGLWFYAVTVSHTIANSGFQDRISDTNANGGGFVIRNCVILNNRARGMIIKADNGIIENNVIDGSSVGGIEVTPEFWWDESGCSCHVLIEGNTIRHVGYATVYLPGWFQAGAVSIVAHTDTGNYGHNGIAVIGNRFVDDNGINLLIADAENLLVSGNVFIHPMQKANHRGANFHFGTSDLAWLQQCKNILLAGNRVINSGPALKKLVGVGPYVSKAKGINTGIIVQTAGGHKPLAALTGDNATVSTKVIYQDNFTGHATTPLAGQTPNIDTGGAAWIAYHSGSRNQWMANGRVNQPHGSLSNNVAVSLPFIPKSGHIYAASIVLNPRADGNQIFFGFDTISHSNAPFYNGVGPWMDLSDGGTLSNFAGPGASNQGDGQIIFSGAAGKTATVVLNTTERHWTARWYYNGKPIAASYTYTGTSGAIMGITGIGFASNSETGSVAAFKLTDQIVPTPARPALRVKTSETITTKSVVPDINAAASGGNFPALVPARVLQPGLPETVSTRVMRQVDRRVQTPYKYGIIIHPGKGQLVDCPCVYRFGHEWYMLYVQFKNQGYETQLAQSNNLLQWKRRGTVLPFQPHGWDQWQDDGAIALSDTRWGGSYQPEKFDGRYWMSYLGGNQKGYEPPPLSIGMAWTRNPGAARTWHPIVGNPVLATTGPGVRPFEKETLYKSQVIRVSPRILGYPFVMYYNASQKGPHLERIGMAVSRNMTHWIRFGTGPVITNHRGISGDPQIVRMGKLWVMFYFGAFWTPTDYHPPHPRAFMNQAFGTFACSYDLVHWTKWSGRPILQPSVPWDQTYAHKPWMIYHNGVVYQFYCAVGNEGRCIAVATSKDFHLRATRAAQSAQ